MEKMVEVGSLFFQYPSLLLHEIQLKKHRRYLLSENTCSPKCLTTVLYSEVSLTWFNETYFVVT